MYDLASGQLLKAVEVARILQISRTAAYRLIASGDLPGIRFAGKTVRVRPQDLEKFIADHPIIKNLNLNLDD
jgi:excisionase family DNA binding protein